ncbi:hypothetical protein [Bremerella cremea]|uniref:hypothetical protein n=1 Tax=Bremerella cremea TaxID=1031537 RepID=UPI0031F027D0
MDPSQQNRGRQEPLGLDEILNDFQQRKRWPKDVAEWIVRSRPDDELLLNLMNRDCQRHQSLALHVVGQLVEIDSPHVPGRAVAAKVLQLLESEWFKPKRRYLRGLKLWASQAVGT